MGKIKKINLSWETAFLTMRSRGGATTLLLRLIPSQANRRTHLHTSHPQTENPITTHTSPVEVGVAAAEQLLDAEVVAAEAAVEAAVVEVAAVAEFKQPYQIFILSRSTS